MNGYKTLPPDHGQESLLKGEMNVTAFVSIHVKNFIDGSCLLFSTLLPEELSAINARLAQFGDFKTALTAEQTGVLQQAAATFATYAMLGTFHKCTDPGIRSLNIVNAYRSMVNDLHCPITALHELPKRKIAPMMPDV